MSAQQIQYVRSILTAAEEKVGMRRPASTSSVVPEWDMPEALARLFPAGFGRGMTIGIGGSWAAALILAGVASAAGSWCAFLGCPDVGWASARSLGVVPERTVVVPQIEQGAVDHVLSAAFDGFGVVVVGETVHLDGRARRAAKQRAAARGVLLLGWGWDERYVVSTRTPSAEGLEAGYGHLSSWDLVLVNGQRTCPVQVNAGGWRVPNVVKMRAVV